MLQIKARLVFNQRVRGASFRLKLNAPGIALAALPGQFVQVRISDNINPFLRRPFSIYRAGTTGVEIIYQVVGQATEILSKKKRGEYLDVVGPLGSSFGLASEGVRLIVAGGVGVAPLYFLAERLTEGKTMVLLGGKTKQHILCAAEFRRLGCAVKISTDDGSQGFKGRVTDLLKHLLPTIGYRLSVIYACGPRPMLKEINRIALRFNIPAQISLEEHMACGIGACLGCVVDTRDGYRRVCKEGPVFDAAKIRW